MLNSLVCFNCYTQILNKKCPECHSRYVYYHKREKGQKKPRRSNSQIFMEDKDTIKKIIERNMENRLNRSVHMPDFLNCIVFYGKKIDKDTVKDLSLEQLFLMSNIHPVFELLTYKEIKNRFFMGRIGELYHIDSNKRV
jgi:hypothetical protein